MKLVTTITLFFLTLSTYVQAQEEPPVDYVFDLYHFCVDGADEDSEYRDTETLTCINEDLEVNHYRTFASLKEVLTYIEEISKD